MNRRQLAFTLVELLVVIAIIAILAGLVLGLVSVGSAKSKQSRVQAHLKAIEQAIRSYKLDLGFYPPSMTNVAGSSLYYELVGTRRLPSGGYETLDGSSTISAADMSAAFLVRPGKGIAGFANSEPETAKNFYKGMDSKMHGTVSLNGRPVEMLVVGVDGPTGLGRSNVWRYTASSATNNSGSFDLWAEILIRGKTNIVGNWKE